MSFSIIVYHKILNTVPLLCSRTLLFIHPIYTSLHLPIPPATTVPAFAAASLFLVSTSLFLFDRYIHLCRILDSTYKQHRMAFSSLIAQLVKNPPALQETPVQFLSCKDPLEKGKATHYSILA